MQKFGLMQETHPDRASLTWVVSLVGATWVGVGGGAKVVDAEGAPCHTVPLDSIATRLAYLLAQSGPLEYAEENFILATTNFPNSDVFFRNL